MEAPSVKYWIVTCATQQHYTIDHTDDDDQNEGNMIFTCCALHFNLPQPWMIECCTIFCIETSEKDDGAAVLTK